MRRCNNCGKSFNDSAMFCNECGSKLIPVEDEPMPETPVDLKAEGQSENQSEILPENHSEISTENQPENQSDNLSENQSQPEPFAYQFPNYCIPEFIPIAEKKDRYIDAVAEFIPSPSYIIMTLSLLIYSLAAMVSPWFDNAGINLFDNNEIDMPLFEEYYDILKQFTNNGTMKMAIFTDVFLIPILISAIGALILLAGNTNRPLSDTGFKLLKVGSLFKVVTGSLSALAFCITVLIVFLMMKLGSNVIGLSDIVPYPYTSYLYFGIVVFMLISLIGFACYIVFYAELTRTIHSAEICGTTGEFAKLRISRTVAVVSIVAGGVSCLPVVASIISGIPNVVFLVQSIAEMLFLIFMGVTILSLKKKIIILDQIDR